MNKYKCAEHLSWRDLEDHIIILDSQKNEQVHHLEEVSADIWRHLDKSLSEEEIITHICSDYDVDSIVASKDYNDFLQELITNDLVENRS